MTNPRFLLTPLSRYARNTIHYVKEVLKHDGTLWTQVDTVGLTHPVCLGGDEGMLLGSTEDTRDPRGFLQWARLRGDKDFGYVEVSGSDSE